MILKYLRRVILVSLAVMVTCLPCDVFAQAGGFPPDPCTDPNLPCPIDGGLSFLIAAAVGLGAKKAYDAKKQNGKTSGL